MYYVVSVSKWPRPLEDWIIDQSFEVGASGVSEKLDFTQKDYESPAEERTHDPYDLEIYFPEKPDANWISVLQGKAPDAQVLVRAEEDKDWLEEWKKGYEPFEICRGLHIVPRWRPIPPEADKVILLEPGMAFGTGTHETTRLASQLLAERIAVHAPTSILDVGTGTGILAMLASKFGVPQIVAVDIEQEARRVAKENLVLNQVTNVQVLDVNVEKVSGLFDIVVANIVDHVLLKIQSDLVSRLKPRGELIVCGVLRENLSEFKQGFRLPDGYEWRVERQGPEWVALAAGPG